MRFEDLRDQGDPAESALRYAEQGADEIVFLDISAAPEERDTDVEWVRRTAEQVFIPLTVGGGVRSEADAKRLLRSGADKVGINSAGRRAAGADPRARPPLRQPVRGPLGGCPQARGAGRW